MSKEAKEPSSRKSGAVKQAVALAYKPDRHAAPVVKAKGKGEVAEKIARIAAENGVPVREDASLVEILSKLELDHEIPPELYQLVAEILSYIYIVDREAGEVGGSGK